MKFVCCQLFVCLAVCVGASAHQTAEVAVNDPEAERQELQAAIKDAGPSAPDFVRALEKHLTKYPSTTRKHEIVKALYQGSLELQDSRRIALYGEQMIAADPDDASLLAAVGEALNTLNDRAAAAKALDYGKRLERTLADAGKTDGKAVKMKADAMLIEADASGILDKNADAIKFAASSYELAPSAVAARSLGRWNAKGGNFEQAVDAYAAAFAMPDSDRTQNDDRRKLEECYRKTHTSNVGLGDVVLRAYDRAAAQARQLGETPERPSDMKLSGVDGDTLSLASLKGKVIVMDFWATWCGPCRTQHPLYEQVKQRFEKNRQVVFLEINSDDDRSAVAPFLAEQRWNRQVYFDDGLGQAYKVKNIPTTVLLDQQGNLYSKMIGFRPDAFVEQLTSRINEALQAKN